MCVCVCIYIFWYYLVIRISNQKEPMKWEVDFVESLDTIITKNNAHMYRRHEVFGATPTTQRKLHQDLQQTKTMA